LLPGRGALLELARDAVRGGAQLAVLLVVVPDVLQKRDRVPVR
jgi:hypothetical protein